MIGSDSPGQGFPSVEKSYKAELVRKAIHLCSLSIPIVYSFISKSTALSILVPLTLLFLAADLVRHSHGAMNDLFNKYVGWLLRPHERSGQAKRLNGATYVLLSACLCVWLFPKVVTITVFAILIVSDTSAALVGRKLGKHRFFGKSLEGAAAFLISALIVVAVAPKIGYLPAEYVVGVIVALLGAVVESLSIPVDDNFSIPISTGLAMWFMYSLFLPDLNVFALDIIG